MKHASVLYFSRLVKNVSTMSLSTQTNEIVFTSSKLMMTNVALTYVMPL